MRPRLLLLALCVLCLTRGGTAAPSAEAGAQSSSTALTRLRSDIEAATRMPGVQHGIWGIVVHSLARDERLFELNPRTLMVPASAIKLVSAASAAEAVGWDYRWETSIRATGRIEDGVLHGDLVVVGSGDPSIGGRGGNPLSDWIGALRAVGIERIEGRIIGDDDALEEPRPALAWGWDDLGYPAGAIFGALNLAENRMTVTITAGAVEGGPTTVRVGTEDATHRPVANRTVTGPRTSQTLVWPEQRPGEPLLTIAGSVAAGSRPITLSISVGNPTLAFANELRSLLINSGIDVTGGAYDIDDADPKPDSAAADVLFVYASPTLGEIVRPLFSDSLNIYGEAFLRLNAAPGAFPTNDAALEGLAPRLEAWGIPAEARQIVDGSGMSRRNTITPEAFLVVLRRMYDPSGRSPFVAALPVAGLDGTLAGRMKGTAAAGNVRAKTGTMTNIRSLAGYVTTRDGEPLAFAIMLNNFEGTSAEANLAIDTIAARLAGFSR